MIKIYKKGTIVMIDNGVLIPLSPEMPILKIVDNNVTVFDTTTGSTIVDTIYTDIANEQGDPFNSIEECITYLKDFIYE